MWASVTSRHLVVATPLTEGGSRVTSRLGESAHGYPERRGEPMHLTIAALLLLALAQASHAHGAGRKRKGRRISVFPRNICGATTGPSPLQWRLPWQEPRGH